MGINTPEITDAAVLVPYDAVPRFAMVPDAGSPTIVNLSSGNFSDPTIWTGGLVPNVDARVQIASDTVVTYDLDRETRLDCIEVDEGAHLIFASDQVTKLYLNELMVLPGAELTIGSESEPIADNVSASVIFRGDTESKAGTLDAPGIDPRQYGRGLLVFGKINVYGRALNQSYIRFSKEPLAGEMNLELTAPPSGWKAGDRLLIPDTRQLQFTKNYESASQGEEIIISSIEGNTVTLTAPLAHDHRGPRDVDGNVGPTELAMLPHVGNLTRNVIFRSEDSSQIDKRGHTMFFYRADIDCRYAAFEGLGRTTIESLNNTAFNSQGELTRIGSNQIGRYSIHCHHVWGPENPTNTGYQLKFIGNVMNGMLKWGLTVHDTHYGLFQENIAYDGKGSAIATEDGNEAYNVFERNFVVHTRAGDTQRILPPNTGRGGVFSRRALFGTTRDAFWFSGEYNYVRDNVAANTPDFAFNYNGYYLENTMRIPRFRGADLLIRENYEGWNYRGPGSQFDPELDRREGLPVLESCRNEIYSSGQGLWLTWSRGCCNISYYKQVSLFEDYKMWHLNHTGVHTFHESRNTFIGFIMRNDPSVSILSGSNARFNQGFFFGNDFYENGQIIVRDFDVQGFNIGIALPPKPQDGTDEENVTLIENGVLKNHVNIRENFASFSEGKKTIIRNVRFTPFRTYDSNSLPEDPVNIFMDRLRNKRLRPVAPSQTFVYDFNGESGNSFQVFWEEQAPDAIVLPGLLPRHDGDPNFTCPTEGLTNQACLQQFGIVTAGAIAPIVEIDGGDITLSQARAAERTIAGLVFPIVEAPQLLTFEAWRQIHFEGGTLDDLLISGAEADPDKDGRVNLLEFAIGSDPQLSEPEPVQLVRSVDGGMVFSRSISKGRSGLDYIGEMSRDLSGWTSDQSALMALDKIDNGDGSETLSFSAIEDSADIRPVFFRLKVVEQVANE